MVSEDPRPGEDPDDERRRQPSERNTEPIPIDLGPDYAQIVEFDDHEFAALGANQAGVGFDRVDLIATSRTKRAGTALPLPDRKVPVASGGGTGSTSRNVSASGVLP